MSRLQAVPEQPKRVRGVIRVSKERVGMISPELQEHAIREASKRNGLVLVEPFLYGIDESGSQRRSGWWRKLDDAVAEVEAGAIDGIIVWKFSRAARQRLKWAVAVDRIEVAGGVLLSATEEFDVETAAGRFARGVTAEMNAFQAEMIGEQWTETHERRVRNGKPHSGARRFGYIYDRTAKAYSPDPDTSEVLADLYRRFVAGEGFYSLTSWLNARQIPTTWGKRWSDFTLRRVLDSGFGAGLFPFRGELHQGVHEPVIDADAWQAYQDARNARRTRPAREKRSQYVLSGMVRCASCGSAMVAQGLGGHQSPVYRCSRRKTQGEAGCATSTVRVSLAEEHVLAYLREVADDIDDERAAMPVIDGRRRFAQREGARLAAELKKANDALVRLAVNNATDPLPSDVYAASKAELEQRVIELKAALDHARIDERESAVIPQQAAAGLLETWEERPVEQRREVLRGLIDCVLMRRHVGSDEVYLRIVEWVQTRN